MSLRRAVKAVGVSAATLFCGVASIAIAQTAGANPTGPGASGNEITNALQAQTPFTPGTLDSGQPVDVVIPTNSVLASGASIFILECAAPNGVDPTSTTECDGETGYSGGTITVASDGSVDVVNSTTGGSDIPYTVYALPDKLKLGETSSNGATCGLGSANECVLYVGEGGGGDTGMTQPHFFSQPFQIHPDPNDNGSLNPGDGTFTADTAPGSITTANHATFTQGTTGTFDIGASGYPPPAFTETGTLPTGVKLTTTYSDLSSTGVLSGKTTQSGTFPITLKASNGVGIPTTQSFTLTVNPSTGTAPTITSANSTAFTQGVAGTFTETATGTPTPALGEMGALPAGVTFNSPSGVLSGTPSVTGSFPITFTASNGVLPNASQSFTLTVNAPPFQISTSSLPDATPGVVYGPVQFHAIGTGPGATLKWKKAAALPKGLKLNGLGVLSGVPSTKKLTPNTNVTVSVQVTETVITYVNTGGKKPTKVKTKTMVPKSLTLHIA